MKSGTLTIFKLLLLVLVNLAVAPFASGYYDPGVQRWINRDPIDDIGFETLQPEVQSSEKEENSFRFVVNNSISAIDALELIVNWPFPRWNTLPGPACNAYACSATLKAACNSGGNNAWSNCVRGCLLTDFNPNTCSYASGGVARHLYCWCRCALQPPGT